MGELAARAEVLKLAHELGTDAGELAFLLDKDEAELATFRNRVSSGLFGVHESRLRRIASLSKLLPMALSAKIAQAVLAPMLCGRIAGVLERDQAVKLSAHFPAAFLAEVSKSIDPDRTAEIVRALPDSLVLDVGRILLDQGEYIVLGRFVAVVDERVAAQVIAMADGAQLLQASFYAEDRARIDPLVAHVGDDVLDDVIRAAAAGDLFDEAASLLAFIGPDTQERLSHALVRLGDVDIADGVVRAIVNLGAWDELLPVVGRLPREAISLLVNVPTTRDPEVIADLIDQVLGTDEVRDNLIGRARELGYFPMLVTVIDALDDEHRAVLNDVPELDDPELRAFAASLVDVPVETIGQAIEAFRNGAELPAELVAALDRAGAPA